MSKRIPAPYALKKNEERERRYILSQSDVQQQILAVLKAGHIYQPHDNIARLRIFGWISSYIRATKAYRAGPKINSALRKRVADAAKAAVVLSDLFNVAAGFEQYIDESTRLDDNEREAMRALLAPPSTAEYFARTIEREADSNGKSVSINLSGDPAEIVPPSFSDTAFLLKRIAYQCSTAAASLPTTGGGSKEGYPYFGVLVDGLFSVWKDFDGDKGARYVCHFDRKNGKYTGRFYSMMLETQKVIRNAYGAEFLDWAPYTLGENTLAELKDRGMLQV